MFRHRSSCFWPGEQISSQHNAQANCRKNGGRLAAPVDGETQTFITSLVQGGRYHSHWVGIQKTIGGVWKFSDNSNVTSSSFTHWAPREPRGVRDENCVFMGALVHARWVTTQCHWGYRFICQLDGCDPSLLGLMRMDLHPDHHRQPTPRLFFPGDAVNVKCIDRGMSVKGSSTVHCLAGGKWNNESRCAVEAKCPTPRLPPHSHLFAAKTMFDVGEIAPIVCRDGYIMHGRPLTCMPNGEWEGTPPQCRSEPLIVTTPKPEVKQVPTTRSQPPKPEPKPEPKAELRTEERCSFGRMLRTPLPSTSTMVVPEGRSVSIACSSSSSSPSSKSSPRSMSHSAAAAPLREDSSSGGSRSYHLWMKEQVVLRGNHSTGIPHTSISADGATLHIRSMSHAAEGLYTCISDGLVYKAVHVVIPQKSCHMKLEISPEREVVTEGDIMILRCFAPDAEISWFRDEVPVLGDEHHLVLPSGALLIRRGHLYGTSTYMCRLEHSRTRCRVERSVAVSVEADVDVVCGRSKVDVIQQEDERLRHGKVVGGKEATRGAHPWTVILVTFYKVRNETHLCGGSLISDRWVATAAHCFVAASEDELARHIKVKLGKHDRTRSEEGELVVGVDEIVLHSSFDRSLRSFDNDVALLLLDRSVPFSERILPICLPPPAFFADTNSLSGVVSGWGKLMEDGLQPRIMHHVRLPVVAQSECTSSTNLHVTGNMFCAGYAQAVGDSCQGDSGGPFEVVANGRAVLAGIVSWGEGCSRAGKYGFYTKVENYVGFIYDTITGQKKK